MGQVQDSQARKTAGTDAERSHEALLRRHRAVYAKPGLPPFSYHPAGTRLYVGRNPLTAHDAAEMAALGITHVLDLREAHEWETPGKLGREGVEALAEYGVTRRHIPVTDTGAPTEEALDMAWEECQSAWSSSAQAVVYVHCRAGRERTGAVVAAIEARRQGISFDAALTSLKARGAGTEPLTHQQEAARRWVQART